VVTADSIAGPWTDPVDLKIGNIDPGHMVGEDGKRYLFFSGGGYAPLSDDGTSITGEVKYNYKGWPIPREWSIECFCMEGPKLIKRGEYYYQTVAQGGTAGPATSHMVVSARSKSLFGPWENSPYNPIIRTKAKTEKWWSKGHGTLIEDTQGKWWIVFHAYENGHYNMGRQTLLEPIEWTRDGWFKSPDNIKTDEPIKKPAGKSIARKHTLSDNFSNKTLSPQWAFYKEYDTTRFHFGDNSLVIKSKGDAVGTSSPLLCMPYDHSYKADVELIIEGNAIGGLVLFYNDRAFSGIAADNENILAIVNGSQFTTEKKAIKNRVFLRIQNLDNTLDMFFSNDGATWTKIENSVEVSAYNQNILGGFLSLRIGLVSLGDGTVTFKNFKYESVK
jgi:beta-xylosidase